MNKLTIIFLFYCIVVAGQEQSFTLEQAINYAWENNLTIKDQQLQEQISAKEVEKTRSNLLPTLGISAGQNFEFGSVINPATNSRETLDIQSSNIALSSNVDLFNWQNFERIKIAKLEKEKVRYNIKITKNDILIQVVQAFYQLQFSKEQLKLVESQIENTKTHLSRIEEEVDLGNKSESDLLEMKANLTSDYQRKTNAESVCQQAYLSLQNLLNRKDSSNYLFENELLVSQPSEEIQNLYENGLSTRPEIKLAQKDEEIAQKQIDEQKSLYYPTLSAGYSLSSFYTDSRVGAFSDQIADNRSHFIRLSLNIPIFNKLQTKKSVEQSKIELERSQLQIRQYEQEYYNLLSEAYLKTNNSYNQWQSSETNLNAHQLSFEKTNDKFEFGMINIYEYLTAKNNLLQVESDNLIAKYTFYMNSVLLNWYSEGQID
ncbi:TolC family protein [Moheibacter lacus]|uniref:TolC family protein n=1 Tax=Moheibacter lacus TaxID=2745851 RepID=A0A838ZSA7_9FLAO|nr:TolC family protein [Moheibacter lacus]MBA5629229.1 TolC family protein [Moheibacter lacus]